MVSLSVTNAKLALLSGGTGRFQHLSVTGTKIAKLTVDDSHIANLNVNKLLAGEIDTSKIKICGWSAINYTLIGDSYFESRGRFTRTWLGKNKLTIFTSVLKMVI